VIAPNPTRSKRRVRLAHKEQVFSQFIETLFVHACLTPSLRIVREIIPRLARDVGHRGLVRLPGVGSYPLVIPLTRHSPFHSDKLSRLAPLAELFECHSTYRIGGLAECGRMAPFLRGRLALI